MMTSDKMEYHPANEHSKISRDSNQRQLGHGRQRGELGSIGQNTHRLDENHKDDSEEKTESQEKENRTATGQIAADCGNI
jgi:hypothetical protein